MLQKHQNNKPKTIEILMAHTITMSIQTLLKSFTFEITIVIGIVQSWQRRLQNFLWRLTKYQV
jgi:hypothetical protein